MIIIGEKINGAIPNVRVAVERRDENPIRELAKKQTEAGAHYLDVCAGTAPEVEAEALIWMITVVQDAVGTPLCIDSPNARTIEKALRHTRQPGIVNSVHDAGEKCEIVFPLISGTKWQVIAQTENNHGMPKDSKGRLEIAGSIIEKACKYRITPDQIHIDPLVASISADNMSVLKFFESATLVKTAYPTVKTTAAISNISFGLPIRRLLNQQFYALAAFSGLDSAILDPCDRDMRDSILATDALLGRDRYCRRLTNSYRKNRSEAPSL